MPGADEVRPLLDQFTASLRDTSPLAALWAHGSLALGDFRPGRSDLDLIALIDAAPASGQRDELQARHEALQRQVPMAVQLHCSYLVRADLTDIDRDHLTWAHGELFARPVTPVTRRELHQGGLCLFGPAPSEVVPPVTDQQLADFIRADLRDYWYPQADLADQWLRDIWVDLGLLTFARATVTLREGRLITKREALDVLPALGAPAAVVRDIYRRRYEDAPPIPEPWRAERAVQARGYLRAAIKRTLSLP